MPRKKYKVGQRGAAAEVKVSFTYLRCSTMHSLEYQLCNPLPTRGEIQYYHNTLLATCYWVLPFCDNIYCNLSHYVAITLNQSAMSLRLNGINLAVSNDTTINYGNITIQPEGSQLS